MSDSGSKKDVQSLNHVSQRVVPLMNLSAHGIVITDGTEVVDANRAMVRLLNLSGVDDVLGRRFATLFDVTVRDGTVKRLNELQKRQEDSLAAVSSRLLCDDGSLIDVQVSTALTEATFGKEFVYLFRPVYDPGTSSRPSSEQLQQLCQLYRMAIFGEISASLLHELGQPITAAVGASEILRDGLSKLPLNSDQTRAAEILCAALAKSTDQFRRVWEYIRIRKPKPGATDVSLVVQDAVSLFAVAARHADITVEFKDRSVARPWIDDSLLGQVIAMLLHRSVILLSAVLSKKRILRVEILQPFPSRVEVVVEHNGDDLTAAEQYYQSYQTALSPDERHPPNLLSLSVCRMILDEVGGILTVEPWPGQGGIRYRLVMPI